MLFNIIIGILTFSYMTYKLGKEFFLTLYAYRKRQYVNNCVRHSIDHMQILFALWFFGLFILAAFGHHSIELDLHEQAHLIQHEHHLDIIYYALFFYNIAITMLFGKHIADERREHLNGR